jgi:hypothetical protein
LSEEKQEFATSKEESEAILKRLEFKRTQLEGVTTPDEYVNWALSSFDDPVLGRALREDGSSPEKVMERINQVAQQPNALQNLIEESKLGSDEYARLVKDRAGQQITVRGQDKQANNAAGSRHSSSKLHGVVKTLPLKQRGVVKTFPSVVSVTLRSNKILLRQEPQESSWLRTKWKRKRRYQKR